MVFEGEMELQSHISSLIGIYIARLARANALQLWKAVRVCLCVHRTAGVDVCVSVCQRKGCDHFHPASTEKKRTLLLLDVLQAS